MPSRPTRRDRQMVRILGLLAALLEGGRPSVRELASRFNTRRETIYPDLRALSDAGTPSLAMRPDSAATRASSTETFTQLPAANCRRTRMLPCSKPAALKA